MSQPNFTKAHGDRRFVAVSGLLLHHHQGRDPIDHGEEIMRISHHAEQRMNRRGISRRLMDFTLRHGRVEEDKCSRPQGVTVDHRVAYLRLARQAMDKSGVTVVDCGEAVVTAYNAMSKRRRSTKVNALPKKNEKGVPQIAVVCHVKTRVVTNLTFHASTFVTVFAARESIERHDSMMTFKPWTRSARVPRIRP